MLVSQENIAMTKKIAENINNRTLFLTVEPPRHLLFYLQIDLKSILL